MPSGKKGIFVEVPREAQLQGEKLYKRLGSCFSCEHLCRDNDALEVVRQTESRLNTHNRQIALDIGCELNGGLGVWTKPNTGCGQTPCRYILRKQRMERKAKNDAKYKKNTEASVLHEATFVQ